FAADGCDAVAEADEEPHALAHRRVVQALLAAPRQAVIVIEVDTTGAGLHAERVVACREHEIITTNRSGDHLVVRRAIARRDLLFFTAGATVTAVNVDGSVAGARDLGVCRSDRHDIARYRDRKTEVVAVGPVAGRERLLGDERARVGTQHVNRTGLD